MRMRMRKSTDFVRDRLCEWELDKPTLSIHNIFEGRDPYQYEQYHYINNNNNNNNIELLDFN
jgi:hypothetical protein